MSIATLKRKTQAQYNNLSVGQNGFSLNGTRRSAGYVGQDMLGRSLVRSLAGKDGTLKGHGGCCGKYPIISITTTPEMAPLNNPTVVKSSSVGTSGLLATKYRWLRRPAPYSSWKPSDNFNTSGQGDYIDNLARQTIEDSCHDMSGNDAPIKCCDIQKYSYSVNWKKRAEITKPVSSLGAIDNAEYIRTLSKKCPENDLFYIPKTAKTTPFACRNSK
jgi:hypothetical protein